MADWQRPSELPDLSGVDPCSIDTEENDEGSARRSRLGLAVEGRIRLRNYLAWCEPVRCARSTSQCGIPTRQLSIRPRSIAGSAEWSRRHAVHHAKRAVRLGLDHRRRRHRNAAAECLEEVGAMAALVDENHRNYSLDDICARRLARQRRVLAPRGDRGPRA